MGNKFRTAALLIAALLALGWAVNRWISSPIPSDFQPLAQQLSQSESVQLDLRWPQPGTHRQSPVSVRWHRDQKAAVDVPQARVTLIDGRVQVGTAELKLPIPSLSEPGQELLDEILSGFSASTWRSIDPPAHGIIPPRSDRHWAAIILPFDWARGHELQLGVSKRTGQLEAIVVQALRSESISVDVHLFRGGSRSVDLSEAAQLWLVIEDVQWDPDLPPDAFTPEYTP